MKPYLFTLLVLLTCLACATSAGQVNVTPSPNPTLPPQPTLTTSPTPVMRNVCAALLNIRQSANPEALILGSLAAGETVELVTENRAIVHQSAPDGGLWVRIRTSSLEGWVNHRYLCEQSVR